MTKEILYVTALDSNDKLVHIKDATKGRIYYCPQCQGQFILRKSGKIGKGSKRPHFAHNNLSANCTPEGVLHYSFKKQLIDLLERYKSESRALIINWKCHDCSVGYSNANLLAKTTRIEEEYNLKECRPDIALLDTEENVIATIEIVVTHEPEENALRYYERNGITLIQINLFSEEDLDRVEDKIANPDIVNFCLNPTCSIFKNHEIRRNLIFEDIKCASGRHLKRTCHVEADSVFSTITTPTLTQEEMRSAQKQGVQFKVQVNKSTKVKSYVISCPECDKNANNLGNVLKEIRRRLPKRRGM